MAKCTARPIRLPVCAENLAENLNFSYPLYFPLKRRYTMKIHEFQAKEILRQYRVAAVSYTHLTLPTIYSV